MALYSLATTELNTVIMPIERTPEELTYKALKLYSISLISKWISVKTKGLGVTSNLLDLFSLFARYVSCHGPLKGPVEEEIYGK